MEEELQKIKDEEQTEEEKQKDRSMKRGAGEGYERGERSRKT